MKEKNISQSKSKKNIFLTNQKMGGVDAVSKDRKGLVLLPSLFSSGRVMKKQARKKFEDRKKNQN